MPRLFVPCGTEKGDNGMIRIFKSVEDVIRPVDSACEGCWIALTDPTATEVFEISQRHEIDVDHLRAALDEEERSRIEVEDNYTLILVDIPVIEEKKKRQRMVWNHPPWHYRYGGRDFYHLYRGYPDPDFFHGRKGAELFHGKEDKIYSSDPV